MTTSRRTSPAIKLLYDGLCPICAREIRWLKRFDRHDRVAIEDITQPDFDPTVYGLTHDDVIGAMHGVAGDGTVVTGMEAFRRAYSAVGLGWLVQWTAWPIARPIADAGYRVFARIRPRLSRYAGRTCETDRCHRAPPSTQSREASSSATS